MHTSQEIEHMGTTNQWKLRNIAALLLLGGLLFQVPRAVAANSPQVTGSVFDGPVMVDHHQQRFLYRVHFGPKSATPFLGLLARADLTPHQRQQIGRIMRESGFRSMAIFRRLREVREQIADRLLEPGRLSPADLAPLERRSERLQRAMDRNMMRTALSIRSILTPEQIAHAARINRKLTALRRQIQELLGPGPEAAFMDAPR